ncbi:small secreted protein [Streptomyces lunaelactis]|uniref:Small secreted protein n=1 Tax=Streptomyces lunaelactis TaxID=1535768 RepID=A0A2R4T5L8_9ACTN|nr:small secreted protein [Streptomyces lunaelactis]AVZ74445.1 small secreted protein [Streptomyces lunaelactis]NUK23074.1 small secreted protein [Streptomyces lunaelactis]NUK84288.1 small secreted protein [Streptomyces lunaelactis]
MNKKLAAALSGGAVLVLALSGCSNGDDTDSKVNAWAKTVCDQAQPQIQKRANAQQTIISTAADGKPSDIQAADSKAFQEIADADKALATAVKGAGTPPVDNGEKLQQDAVNELEATSKAYLDLKKQVDALDSKDQQKFADGLQGVADGLKKIEKMDQDALTKLQSGELGKAMAKEPGCRTAKASTPPAAASDPSKPAGASSSAPAKAGATPSDKASSKA